MSIFDEIQGQAQQFGSQAAQGAVQQVQTALPGLAEQASQVVQQQIPVMQQVVQQAGHEVGRDVGAGARQGLLSDLSTTETVLLGAGVFAALTLVGVAAYRSTGSRSAPELPYYKDPNPTRAIKLNAMFAELDPNTYRYLDNNHYRISDRKAGELVRELSRELGREVKLPRPGYELQVKLDGGQSAWLLRTPHSYGEGALTRGWVWAVRPNPTREIKLNALNASERVEEVDIEHIELDNGGYTKIGRYFGVGAPLFYYTHSVPNDRFVGGYENRGDYFRAEDRADAVRKMRKQFPNAKIA